MESGQVIDFMQARAAREQRTAPGGSSEIDCAALLRDLGSRMADIDQGISTLRNGLSALSETCHRLSNDCGQTVEFCEECLQACELTDIAALEQERDRLKAEWQKRIRKMSTISE